MKFNVYFKIRGPENEVTEVPYRLNPLTDEDMHEMLLEASHYLPASRLLGVETVGVRMEWLDKDGKEYVCTGKEEKSSLE